jgi:hypothetical protein
VCPTSPDEWRPIAEEFLNRRNIRHTCGTLDGTYVAIRCPSNTGSRYQNFKGFFCCLDDAQYTFIWVGIDIVGSMSDCQNFNDLELIGFPQPDS